MGIEFPFFLTIIFALFATWYVGAVLFLRWGLLRNRIPSEPNNLTFSIVIAARNEELYIERCIRSVMNQTIDSSRFEVIVANDRSQDGTGEILYKLQKEFQNLKVVTIAELPDGYSPKKNALTHAVAEAVNEIIVYTDADCVVKDMWLETIDRHFEEDTGLVQGITTYYRDPGMSVFLYGFQAIEFLSHGIVSASAIGAGFPLNSNANNLAFRRSVFEQIDGYSSVRELVSGDDDLLVQRIWRDRFWQVRYMIDYNGAVVTTPTPTIRGIFEQRKRWGSKTVHYNAGQIAFLGGIFSFYLGIVSSSIAGFFVPGLWPLVGILWAVKVLGEALLMLPGMKLFRQQSLLPFFLPASLLQLPMTIMAVFLGVFGSFEWKQQQYTRRLEKQSADV